MVAAPLRCQYHHPPRARTLLPRHCHHRKRIGIFLSVMAHLAIHPHPAFAFHVPNFLCRRDPMDLHLGERIVGPTVPTVPMAFVDHLHLDLDFYLVLVLVVDSDQSLDRRYFT